jgi:hypothetical protein
MKYCLIIASVLGLAACNAPSGNAPAGKDTGEKAANAAKQAEPAAGAHALIDGIYRTLAADSNQDSATILRRHGSSALVAALDADLAATPDGEIGTLDFDIFSNSQDPDIRDVQVLPAQCEATSACNVEVHFRNREDSNRIRFRLVHETAEWKIDNAALIEQNSADGWDLRDMLKQARSTVQSSETAS